MHGDSADLSSILDESYRLSSEVFRADGPDGLWCLFGIRPIGSLLTPVAAPWQLGTEIASAHPIALVNETKRYIHRVRERYAVLVNYVDARNTPSLRYLHAVGFSIDPPAPVGSAGLPFHRFHMGLGNV